MAYLHSKHLLPILSSILIFLSSLSFAANTGGTLPQAAPSTPARRGFTQEEHLANVAAARRKRLERMDRENTTRELRSRGAYETGTAYDAQRAADYYRNQYAQAKAENDQIGMKRYKELMDRATDLAQKNLRYSAADKLNRPDDIAMYERYMREQQAGSRSTSKSKRKKSSPVYQYGGVVILLAVIAGAIFYVRRKKGKILEQDSVADDSSAMQHTVVPDQSSILSTAKQYYICKPGCTQEGPYPEDMVRTCYKQGIFPADTLIWFDGAPEWMPIQNVFTEQRQAPSMPSALEVSVPPSAASAAESVAATPVAADVQSTPSVATISAPQPSMPGTSAGSVATPPPFVPASCPVPPPFPLQEEATYYVALPGMQPQGPYTKSAVLSGYYQGAYPAGTMVWGPETASWIPVQQLSQPAGLAYPMGGMSMASVPLWNKPKTWNLLTAFTSCMKRYAQFRGRASRAEYWYFRLAHLLIVLVPGLIAAVVTGEQYVVKIVVAIATLPFLLPLLAVQARRLHDRKLSAWWLLLCLLSYIGAIILMIISCLPSKDESNPHGSAPLPPA